MEYFETTKKFGDDLNDHFQVSCFTDSITDFVKTEVKIILYLGHK